MQAPSGLTASAEEIRAAARDVVSRPEFQLETPSKLSFDWIEWLGNLIRRVLEPFGQFGEWLYGASPLLFWMMIVLLLLVVAMLAVHIVYSLRVAIRRHQEVVAGLGRSKRFADPAELERAAAAAAQRQDYIQAVRLAFRACLSRIESIEDRALRLGWTNREVLRRYQNTPLGDALRTFVETIDAKWYGHEVCEAGDYQACLAAQQVVKQQTSKLNAHLAT